MTWIFIDKGEFLIMKKQAILISEDSQIIQSVLSQLMDLKMPTLPAHDIRAAVNALHADICHVLMIDLTMPEDRLINLIYNVRHQNRPEYIPIIAIADLTEPEKLRSALKAGATRYIAKQFLDANLREILREMNLLPRS